MKATVVKDECIACKLCESMCPEIFFIVDDEYAEAKDEEIPENLVEAVNKVKDACPIMCITVE